MLQRLADDLRDDPRAGDDDTVEVVEVGGADAVRRTFRQRIDSLDPGAGEDRRVDEVTTCGAEFFVPVPGGDGAVLLLSYSTPLSSLRDALLDLFDAVTATFAWGRPAAPR